MITSKLMLVLLSLSYALAAQTIAPSQAARHIGEKETVCGTISGEHTATSSRGTPTFINLDAPYAPDLYRPDLG